MSNRYLSTALRRALEKTAKDARIVAEDGARDAVRRLGVAGSKAPTHLSDDEKELRRRLRAHARALGDRFDNNDDTQETKRLIEAAAYAHWHRMLFARFLAERGLLRNPDYDVPVSLEDCRELAEAEGMTDAWAIAERYAASMLPAVFRIDDPVLALDLDPVHTQKLHRLVTGLDAEVFQAEDSLGWTYQFWRAAEKDAVNASGVKIGADELPAVTQLFTEPYMVRFLLHNTLGAWWAGKVLASNPTLSETAADEDEVRAACALSDYSFDMLRLVRDNENGHWRPAAGTFSGWPREAKEITMLDPCCGSGHFLTEALAILAALRHSEEGLSAADAVSSVLRNNLHGLEIDGRCVQIAAFAVALSAWRIGGWQVLPLPHIAWVGAPPPLPKREFIALADGDSELENALAALHDLFAKAPILGTLLEPAGGDLFEAEKLREVDRLLEPLLDKARKAEPENVEGVIAARGMADAAQLLRQHYTIQATNVPFLGQSKQDDLMATYISAHFKEGRADLSTAMLLRLMRLADARGTVALVSPQGWWYLERYKSLRFSLLSNSVFNSCAALGDNSFQTPMYSFNIGLTLISNEIPKERSNFLSLSVNNEPTPEYKERALFSVPPKLLFQKSQFDNADQRINQDPDASNGKVVANYAQTFQGTKSGDDPRWVRNFWEVKRIDDRWRTMQSTVPQDVNYGGCNLILYWGDDGKHLVRRREEGQEAARKYPAVAISQMGNLYCSILAGQTFDSNVSPVFISETENFGALLEYFRSEGFKHQIKTLDPGVKVNNTTFLKARLELQHWKNEANATFPQGIPKPYSSDPTQWIFHGHPADALEGTAVHVALARLCGHLWPAEIGSKILVSEEAKSWIERATVLPPADEDGLLGVPSVAGERPLIDRLRAYLTAAFGSEWSDALERRLVAEADEVLDKKVARDGSLEAWLRDRAFRQHCVLFGQRPFLWHISDGLKDGFSIFVHYHRFDQANLRKLTYTLLGDWLARAKAENNALRYEKGRELQQMLEKVLEGEQPYDIFVRWKSHAQQPLGWDPDLDDGVRQNIRPFIKSGVLTHDLSKILKDKDRGKDVTSAPWYPVFEGERRNDHHTTLAEKRSARDAMK